MHNVDYLQCSNLSSNEDLMEIINLKYNCDARMMKDLEGPSCCQMMWPRLIDL